jgi:hypothetical protein
MLGTGAEHSPMCTNERSKVTVDSPAPLRCHDPSFFAIDSSLMIVLPIQEGGVTDQYLGAAPLMIRGKTCLSKESLELGHVKPNFLMSSNFPANFSVGELPRWCIKQSAVFCSFCHRATAG